LVDSSVTVACVLPPSTAAAKDAAANADALILNFSVPAQSIYREKAVASVTIPVSALWSLSDRGNGTRRSIDPLSCSCLLVLCDVLTYQCHSTPRAWRASTA